MRGTRSTDMLRKALYAGALLVLLTGSASAQISVPGIKLNNSGPQWTPEEQEKQQRIEDAYKRTMEKIPDQKKSDPWGGVRQNPTSASKSKQGQQRGEAADRK
jgi:hypothetical protein